MNRRVKSHIRLKRFIQATMNKWLKRLIKLALSVIAIVLLSQKIEWSAVKQVIVNSNYLLLLVALVLYICSKVVSAIRLNQLQSQIPIELSEKKNTKLYFIGMFYNLFLPGGIGGDGYKAVWLRKNFSVPTKDIVSTLFLDRFLGLAALFLLLFVGAWFTNLYTKLPGMYFWLSILLFVFVLPVTYFVVQQFFSRFVNVFWTTIGLSLLVQLIQIAEAVVLILAIGLSGKVINYIVLFLASSIAAVLPISIGGVGVRELTFIYGNELLNIEKNQAVAFSLLFFIVMAFSSFIGAFLRMENNRS